MFTPEKGQKVPLVIETAYIRAFTALQKIEKISLEICKTKNKI